VISKTQEKESSFFATHQILT